MDIAQMDIGQAVLAIKDGQRVSRAGWVNGVGMWVAYSPGHPGLAAENFWSQANKDEAERCGGALPVHESMTLKTASGGIVMGWSPSTADTLALDWYIVPPLSAA